MRSIVRKTTVSLALSILAIILLPMLVSAETTTQVTETVSIPSETNDNNEVVNIANATIQSNKDTWNPLPSGIFVGGTIAESEMQLNEASVGTSCIAITTEVRFSPAYLSNGASEFIVRLPLAIDEPAKVWNVFFEMYDIEGRTYSIISRDAIGPSPPAVWVDDSTLPLIAEFNDVGNFWNTIGNPTTEEIWHDMGHNSWLSGNRLYVRIIAPILSDHLYLLSTRAYLADSAKMNIYWHSADLASDALTNSRVAYIWMIAPDDSLLRNYPVPVDAGYSFIFQKGLGNMGRDWDFWYPTGSYIRFIHYQQVDSVAPTGGFSFVIEFRTNYTIQLSYDLTVRAINETLSANTITVLKGTTGGYWHEKIAQDVIVAGNPALTTFPTVLIGSGHYVKFEVTLTFNSAQRMQIMVEADQTVSPGVRSNNKFSIYESPTTLLEAVWFSPWATFKIADSVYNETATIGVHHTQNKFWTGVGHWWDEHWIDIANVLLIAGGMFLMAVPGGQVFGLALLAGGVGLFLYDNVPWIRDLVDSAIRLIIDGLKWLGNWLWKIGQMLWKALTWLVDQLIYYGGVLIGLLLVGVAIALFMLPIHMEIKMLNGILYLVKGDPERASASFDEGTRPIKRVLRRE